MCYKLLLSVGLAVRNSPDKVKGLFRQNKYSTFDLLIKQFTDLGPWGSYLNSLSSGVWKQEPACESQLSNFQCCL